MNTLKDNLLKTGLIEKVIDWKDFNNLLLSKKEINIMMGQTFDQGQPLDLLKYGLFLMELEDEIKKRNVTVNSQWLLADHFITLINKEKEVSQSLIEREKRKEFLERINQVYEGNIQIKYSSELTQEKKYHQVLDELNKEFESNSKFKQEMLNSIPKDRRNNPDSVKYPLEELATIFSLNTSIKVGPVYESNYDSPARFFLTNLNISPYIAIYLKKSLPFGNPVILNSDKEEFETFGLTPYKINSKGLKNYRIDLAGGDSLKDKELILKTSDPRVIQDLSSLIILSKKRLGFLEEDSSKTLEDMQKYPEKLFSFYQEYIKDPLTSNFI